MQPDACSHHFRSRYLPTSKCLNNNTNLPWLNQSRHMFSPQNHCGPWRKSKKTHFVQKVISSDKNQILYIFLQICMYACRFKCDSVLFPLPGFVTAKTPHGFRFLHPFPGAVNLPVLKKLKIQHFKKTDSEMLHTQYRVMQVDMLLALMMLVIVQQKLMAGWLQTETELNGSSNNTKPI